MARKFISGATFGDKFEKLFETWCNNFKIAFKKDKTLTNNKRRVKDIKCDYEVILNDKHIYIELKTAQLKQGLDFRLYNDGKSHKLKFHQICKMDYLIVEWRDIENVYIKISKDNFLRFAANHKKNSFNYKDSLQMGEVIQDLEWLQES